MFVYNPHSRDLSSGSYGCSWTYDASERAGSFFSTNYPSNYRDYTHCITQIYATEGHVIRLNFELIELEVNYDYLQVGALKK